MSKPKPIQPLYDEVIKLLCWKYREYTEEELNNILTLLQTRTKDLTFTSDLHSNLNYLYKTLGLHPHPSLNFLLKPVLPLKPEPVKVPETDPKKDSKSAKASPVKGKKAFEEEVPLEPPIPFVVKNLKVDLALIKLLSFCWGTSRANTLKFIKNGFDRDTENAIIQMVSNPSLTLTQLHIDWNFPIDMSLYVNILNNPNIEYLSFRSNELNDEKFQILCEALKTNTTLKYLELMDNKITDKGLKHVVPLLQSDCNLEYIGLGRNRLGDWEALGEWFDHVGRFPMTIEEVEQHREKEKNREATIFKNLKNKAKKGYVPEPIEYLDPLLQLEDGNWVLVKGRKLGIINLALNSYGDEVVEEFDKFLSRQSPEFRLLLTGNPISNSNIGYLVNTHGVKVSFKG